MTQRELCDGCMRVDFLYGANRVSLNMDIHYNTDEFWPREATSRLAVEPDSATLEALDSSSVFSTKLSSLRDGDTVAVVLGSDINSSDAIPLLDTLLTTLRARGVRMNNISIVVGSRWPLPESDLFSKVAAVYAHRVGEVVGHSPTSQELVVEAGVTPTHGTPILVSQTVLGADLVVLVDRIRVDPLIGVTGGHASVLSVSASRTISANRRLALDEPFRPLDGTTPMSVDAMEICGILDIDLCVNVISDYRGSPISVVATSPSEAHGRGIDILSRFAHVRIDTDVLYDLVIVDAGGSPRDSTLYQAVDALYAAYSVTRRNSRILLIAECSQGIGPTGLLPSPQWARSEFRLGMEKQSFLSRVLSERRVILVSSISEQMCRSVFECVQPGSMQDVFDRVQRELEAGPSRVGTLHAGGDMVPL